MAKGVEQSTPAASVSAVDSLPTPSRKGVDSLPSVGVGKEWAIGGNPPLRRQSTGRNRRKGWIEFRKKNGRRYARRRHWLKRDGQWVKSSPVRISTIEPMSEKEYLDWKKVQAKKKKERKRNAG